MGKPAKLCGLLVLSPLVGCVLLTATGDGGADAAVTTVDAGAPDGGRVDAGDDGCPGAAVACDAGNDGGDAELCWPLRIDVVVSPDRVTLYPRPIGVDGCDCSESFVVATGECAEEWSDETQCICWSGIDEMAVGALLEEAALAPSDAGVVPFANQGGRFGGSLWAPVPDGGLPDDTEVVVQGCFGEARVALPSGPPPEVIALVELPVDGGPAAWRAELSDDSTLGHRCRGNEDPSCCGTAPDELVLTTVGLAEYDRAHAVRADGSSTAPFGEVWVWSRSAGVRVQD